jgi:hypothetical protein
MPVDTFNNTCYFADVVFEPGPVLFSDDFNRANAGSLGTPWVIVEMTINIVSNKAAVATSGGAHVALYDQTFSNDQWAEGDMTFSAAAYNSLGPAVRVGPATGDPFYYAWWNIGAAALELWTRTNSSTYTQVGSGVATPAGTYKVRVEVEGTTVRMYRDGALVLTATNTVATTGKPGLVGDQGGPQPTLDNFRCGDLPYIPITTSTLPDTFTRASLGAEWLQINSGWQIVSGKAITTTAFVDNVMQWALPMSGANHEAIANIVITELGGGASGPMVRMPVGVYSGYELQAVGDGWGGVSGGFWGVRLVRVDAGSETVLAGPVNISTSAGTFELRIIAQGSDIRGYVDGVEKVAATDATYTGRFVGLRSYNNSSLNHAFDAFNAGPPSLYVGYRSFGADGNDKVVVDAGEDAAQTFDTYSQFAVVRALGSGGGVSYSWFAAARAASRACYWYLNYSSEQETDVVGQIFTSGGNTSILSVANGWAIIGITKPPGTVIPTYHTYLFSSGVWIHSAGQGNLHGTAAMGAGGAWYLGHDGAAGDETWYGDIAVEAFYPRELTTAEVESLAQGLTSWRQLGLNPQHTWRLDQTPVNDLINSAHQISITGTTIGGGSSPLLVDVPVPKIIAVTSTVGAPGMLTIDKPAGGQAGDWYVVWFQVGDFYYDQPQNAAISGFTREPGGVKTQHMSQNCYFWRKYDGTEGSTFTITGTDSSHWSGMLCYLVRGLPSMWTPATSHVGAQGVNNIIVQAVTAPENSLMIVSYKDWHANPPAVRPAEWTEVVRRDSQTGYSYALLGGDTGRFTITPSAGGDRSMASVLYTGRPTVFSDNFDRVNTVQAGDGNSGQGLGPEWWAPSWEINSNVAHKTGGNDFACFNHDLGTPNHWVEADITPNAYGGGGAGGFGCLDVRTGPTLPSCLLGFWAPDQRWVIGSTVGGYHDLASASSGGIPTFPLHLRFEAEGTSLRLYNNDTLVLSHTNADTALTNTYVGMNAGSEVAVNNYRCGTLPYSYPVS